MTSIQSDRTRLRELHEQGPERSEPRPTAEASRPSSFPSDADLQRAYDRVGDSPEYGAFLRNVGHVGREALHPEMQSVERAEQKAVRKADAAVRERLDVFRAKFSGPYTVDGKSVEARPMFRMYGGFNDDRTTGSRRSELEAICAKAGLSHAVHSLTVGRPTPGQLVKATQALIDAGKLPPGTDDSLEARIRQLQWSYGIGVDCAGYAEQAARAARGETPAAPTHNDAFSGMRSDPRIQKIPIGDIRPGDVIHLDPPSHGQVGHNVVVYRHETADAAKRLEIANRGPSAAAFMAGPGPFHLLEVDSSWGADDGKDYGGFRRDTWIYDAGAARWGYFDHGRGALFASERGPNDEPFAGAFRPRRP